MTTWLGNSGIAARGLDHCGIYQRKKPQQRIGFFVDNCRQTQKRETSKILIYFKKNRRAGMYQHMLGATEVSLEMCQKQKQCTSFTFSGFYSY